MLKILKNLKQSFWSVVIVVLLLVLQAWSDLTLPDFTSKIVNTGIQASGIENAVPKLMSATQMEMLLQLTEEDSKILDDYMLNGSVLTANQEEVIKKYLGENANPEQNTMYILEEIDKEEEENLSKIMADPLTKASLMLAGGANDAQIPEEQKVQMMRTNK